MTTREGSPVLTMLKVAVPGPTLVATKTRLLPPLARGLAQTTLEEAGETARAVRTLAEPLPKRLREMGDQLAAPSVVCQTLVVPK